MDEGFIVGGQWVPCHACQEHLDIVAQKVAPMYGCSPHTASGMILLKLSSVITKEECPFHLCQRRASFSIRGEAVRSES